ncbi:MAG TPA: 3-(cis-5,6-dihydroxycyclohexa-1,3-dien-1-yl)propanoate dehydrogenase [Pseudonocardia sp.]|jgi:NAD(P)-dependent dehydrogenase (short-subunit alcohol dehydrogenase family)
MGWLDGQVALVTGGGSGLGRAVVERFVAEGARVGVLELNPGKAKELTEALGGSVAVTEGSATSWADNTRAVTDTVAAFGRLDTFVGNAGLWDFGTSLEALPGEALPAAFGQLFELNVLGYLLGAKAAIEPLRDSRGSMIFTGSNASFYPAGGGPLYTASKHAVIGLVRQLAYELAPEIRVNGVAPGGMPTDLRGPAALGLADTPFNSLPVDRLVSRLGPLERPIAAAEYTGTYVLLASRVEGATTTGSMHNCDGGLGVRGRKADAALMQDLFG